MRGKESSRRWSTTPTLITPACAGKRDHVSIMLKAFGDHPRMCGEKISLVIRLKTKMGSPPHVRGKDISAGTIARTLGITPACAGKSVITHDLAALCEDHPRMCGEKVIVWPSGLFTVGSPPHVRGKVRRVSRPGRCNWESPPHVRGKVLAALMPENRVRITPACAGKSAEMVGAL